MVQQWRLLLRLRRSHRRTWFQRCWRTCRQTSCAMRCSAGAFLEEPALFYASLVYCSCSACVGFLWQLHGILSRGPRPAPRRRLSPVHSRRLRADWLMSRRWMPYEMTLLCVFPRLNH